MNLWRLQVVENKVHPSDANHCPVVVVAMEEAAEIVVFAFGPDGKDVMGCAVPFETQHIFIGMLGLPSATEN